CGAEILTVNPRPCFPGRGPDDCPGQRLERNGRTEDKYLYNLQKIRKIQEQPVAKEKAGC
ncbi:MAG: hypothetical protein LUH09_09305, partial [Clostridiales bacterium]|nr:hypothetical protein [Clostridiales bacterium]